MLSGRGAGVDASGVCFFLVFFLYYILSYTILTLWSLTDSGCVVVRGVIAVRAMAMACYGLWAVSAAVCVGRGRGGECPVGEVHHHHLFILGGLLLFVTHTHLLSLLHSYFASFSLHTPHFIFIPSVRKPPSLPSRHAAMQMPTWAATAALTYYTARARSRSPLSAE